ncbi:MAG TPA: hypothetical protein DCP08_00030 [Chloroflexi bacterium]|nr:hypothetical protein [Chloroflexota bacterium]
MSKRRASKVKGYIYSRFPEMRGVQPKVSPSQGRYVYTFRKRLPVAGGGDLLQVVRVVADKDGEVLKVSVSR